MKIYITRHSLTTWNEEKRLQGWKNSDLTKQGLEDAKRLGNYLKNQSFDGIYSSPLKRAKETAQLIFPNKTIIEDDRLKEMNFGDYEGKFIDELKKEHGEVKLTSIGSSIKICLVAEGTADIYPRFASTMEWDTAAGHAIAKAAGKELYHQDGCTPLAYNKEDLLNPWFIVK